MNHRRSPLLTSGLSTALVACAALAGCGAADVGKPSGTTPAASPQPATSASSTPPTAIPSTPASPVPAASDASTAPGGSVTKAIGESAELVAGTTTAATLTITGLTERTTCQAFDGSTYTPQGILYEVSLTASLTSDTSVANAAHGLDFLVVDTDAFTLRDSAGAVLQQTGALASNACLENRMPASLTPGEQASGQLLIEAPAGAHTIEWNPWGVNGSGWEWTVPQG